MGSPAEETLYIIGESRTNSDNAITKIYGSYYMALEIDPRDGTVLDMSCTHSLDLTEKFLQKLFIGKSLDAQYAEIEDAVMRRYHGSSTRAVLAAMKDAQKKYLAAVEKRNLK